MQNSGAVEGVRLIAIDCHRDDRGALAILDVAAMRFTPVRSFAIFDVPAGATRGGHALSCDEFLWIAAGSCAFCAADGRQRSSFKLDGRGQGVLVSAGVWVELNDFAPGTVVLGFAPVPYEETRKFATPQPDLIAARAKL